MINRYGIALAASYHLITASHEFRMRGRIISQVQIGMQTPLISLNLTAPITMTNVTDTPYLQIGVTKKIFQMGRIMKRQDPTG